MLSEKMQQLSLLKTEFVSLEKQINSSIEKGQNSQSLISARDELIAKFYNIEKQLASQYNIDCQTMCNLLAKQTGKQWKVVGVGGKSMKWHNVRNDFYEFTPYYGVALLNDNERRYNYIRRNNLDNIGNVIIGCVYFGRSQRTWPSQASIVNSTLTNSAKRAEQKCLEQYNWLHHCLYAKGLLPAAIDGHTDANYDYEKYDLYCSKQDGKEYACSGAKTIEQFKTELANAFDLYIKKEEECE